MTVYKILHGLLPSLSELLVLDNRRVTRGHSFKLVVARCNTDARCRFVLFVLCPGGILFRSKLWPLVR